MDELTVPAALEALGTIGAYVLKAATAAGIDNRAAYRLRLAVDEIATNIIMHGRPGDRGADAITVRAAMDDLSLTISLEDGGPAFNPFEQEGPMDLDQPIEERQMGGLGVFLAIRGVDGFGYERLGALNRNTFVVHRGSPSPVDAR
jgi:anti-sigma regulatory factor (Ser/Thr protein kinase)